MKTMQTHNHVTPLINNLEDLERVAQQVVALRRQHAQITLEMETEIAAVRLRYQQDHPTGTVKGLTSIDEETQQLSLAAHGYCAAHRDRLFTHQKSLSSAEVELGFEFNPPHVEKVRKSESWTEIAKKLKRLAWGKLFVRQPAPPPVEVNKQQLLAHRKTLTASQLAAVGLRIAQDEQFFIRAKSEFVPQIVQEAA